MGIQLLEKEKRISERNENFSLSIEIPLTAPINEKIVATIFDITDNGVSFLIPSSKGYFYENTLLQNIKIFSSDEEILIEKVIVKYCIKNFQVAEIEEYHKIGLEFIKNNDKSFRRRTKRFQESMFKNLKARVIFQYLDNKIIGKLLDCSLYGISLIINNPNFIPQTSSILDLKVILNDELIYNGKGILKNFENTKNGIILRVNLRNDVLNIKKFIDIKKKNQIPSEEKTINNIFYNLDKIRSEYKTAISDMGYILTNIKLEFDHFEKELHNYSIPDRHSLKQEMFDYMEKSMFPKIANQLLLLDNLTNNLSIDDHDIYKDYWQKMLHNLTLGANLPNRVFTKPLGFPGDYEMMNMIYRNDYEGKTLYDKFIHHFFCWIPLSQGNRNRSEYIYNKIKTYQETHIPKNKRPLKITSVACGSAIEIQKFIEREQRSSEADILLLDFEIAALNYSISKLNTLKENNNRNTKLNFIQESIFTMIRKKESLNKISDDQDIIYSMGLFEYLNVQTCQKLICVLYSKLRQGGIMILGNYASNCSGKAVMELGLEWYLIYRTDEELLDLATKLKNTKEIKIEDEPSKNIKFLVIEKK